LFRPYDYE